MSATVDFVEDGSRDSPLIRIFSIECDDFLRFYGLICRLANGQSSDTLGKNTSRKLKVFQAQIGFYDTVVAAPSQAAALRAWGVHQNLFASGEALVATDAAAVEVATANPEVTLRRPVGSKQAFSLNPTGLPAIPDLPKKLRPQAKPVSRRQPAADRSRLNEAEANLRNLEERRKTEEGEFRQQQEELERQQKAAQATYVKNRKRANELVETERAAYRKAGCKD